MEATRVDAAEGWQWIVSGWETFIRNPGMLVLYLVILLGIAIVLALLPFIGHLVMMLILPVLWAGWYEAAQRLSRGESISADTLFVGFRSGDRLGPLVTLGAILLAGEILLMVILVFFVGGTVLGFVGNMGTGSSGEGMVLGAGMVLTLLIVVAGGGLLAMAFLYAVPLVWFRNLPPVDALKSSFSACLTNFMPLLVFSLVYLVLIPLAILPLGLGLLVLGPVTYCALYASYCAIYPSGERETTLV